MRAVVVAKQPEYLKQCADCDSKPTRWSVKLYYAKKSHWKHDYLFENALKEMQATRYTEPPPQQYGLMSGQCKQEVLYCCMCVLLCLCACVSVCVSTFYYQMAATWHNVSVWSDLVCMPK